MPYHEDSLSLEIKPTAQSFLENTQGQVRSLGEQQNEAGAAKSHRSQKDAKNSHRQKDDKKPDTLHSKRPSYREYRDVYLELQNLGD
jgi:hypothetical protein